MAPAIGMHEGARPDEGLLGHDGHELLVELGRHGVAAGDAGLASARAALRLPGDETGCRSAFRGSCGRCGPRPGSQSPKVLLRIAAAAGAEDGRHGVLAGLALGVGELLEGLGDDGVEAAGEAGQGVLHGLGHQRRDRVVADGAGDAAGDELSGFRLGDVDAFAGLLAEEVFQKFDEHGSCSQSSTDGVKDHDVIRPSRDVFG